MMLIQCGSTSIKGVVQILGPTKSEGNTSRLVGQSLLLTLYFILVSRILIIVHSEFGRIYKYPPLLHTLEMQLIVEIYQVFSYPNKRYSIFLTKTTNRICICKYNLCVFLRSRFEDHLALKHFRHLYDIQPALRLSYLAIRVVVYFTTTQCAIFHQFPLTGLILSSLDTIKPHTQLMCVSQSYSRCDRSLLSCRWILCLTWHVCLDFSFDLLKSKTIISISDTSVSIVNASISIVYQIG